MDRTGEQQLSLAEFFSADETASCDRTLGNVLCRLGPVADYRAQLLPEERPAVARALPKRQREFATGRVFARKLLAAQGFPEAAIPSDAQRAPCWPGEVLGSISHSDRRVWVALTGKGSGLRGIGIDAERRHRLPEKLHDRLFVESELAAIADAGADFPTWLFSAKEAIYKATRPLAGEFIGFTEAECHMSETGQFTVRYIGAHAPSSIMEQGRGYVMQDAEHAYAVFVIPD